MKLLVRYFEGFLILGLVVIAAIAYYFSDQAQSVSEMRESGYLRVLISDEPDSQYLFNQKYYGFEYELLKTFAEKQGLILKLDVVPFAQLFGLLESGAGDIAVGGIIDNPYVQRVSQPTQVWYEAKTTVVYQRGTQVPKTMQALGEVGVLAGARYYGIGEFEELNLKDDHRSEYQLLSDVAKGTERFVLSTNYRARAAKHYLPDLNRSFILPQKVGLVWALPKQHDPEFLTVLNEFLSNAESSKLTTRLAENYFSRPRLLSTFDALALQRKIKTVLPQYEYAFRRAARAGNLDWTMLAALSYQESRWSNSARSPTGVRGIMQMTQSTAKSLGVTDRMDMSQSINAAAVYLVNLRRRLPKRIKEPQRTWFAVGAYNVGYTHVLNAYKKARELELDRTQWSTISELLPTLYGKPFANGVQAQKYVERVQLFTDILRFYDLHQRTGVSSKTNLATLGQLKTGMQKDASELGASVP